MTKKDRIALFLLLSGALSGGVCFFYAVWKALPYILQAVWPSLWAALILFFGLVWAVAVAGLFSALAVAVSPPVEEEDGP